MTTTIDVRAGMTSASNAAADRLCPGRHLAQRGTAAPKESKDAAAGTLIHKAFSGGNIDLDRLQRKTLNRGRYLELEMVRRFLNSPIPDEEVLSMAHREQRFWAHQNGVPIHSGQIDAFWITPDWKHALIEDLKALFGDVQDATENDQLRDEAAIFWENFPEVESVSVFINQPNVRWKIEDQLLVTYDLTALRRAHSGMTERVIRSNSIDSPRIPGLEQCKFCRAAGTARCPESQKALTKGWAHTFDTAKASRDERGKWISELKSLESTVKKLLASIKEEFAADPKWAAGWEISEGKVIREMPDLMELDARLADYFAEKWTPELTATCVDRCFKVSIPKLEEWFCETVGGDERAAMETFKLLFDSLIVRKQTEGSLSKAKKAK